MSRFCPRRDGSKLNTYIISQAGPPNEGPSEMMQLPASAIFALADEKESIR